MAVADMITILKDGELVQCRPKEECTVPEIAELMVGREVKTAAFTPKKAEVDGGRRRYQKNQPLLEIENLWVNMPGEQLRGVDLTVCKGEILGIGGLAGHGKIALANGVMGLYPSEGAVRLLGVDLPLNDPKHALEQGLAFVSEDRRGVGLVLEDTIANNIVLTSMQIQNTFLKGRWLRLRDEKAIYDHALKAIEEFDIRCIGPHQIVRRLSGGNQQKVCLARAFTQNPTLLFVSEPKRDRCGAKARY